MKIIIIVIIIIMKKCNASANVRARQAVRQTGF